MNATAPDTTELVSRANALASQGRHDEAERAFDQVLDADPRHALALRFKAFRAMNAQRYADAAEFLRRSLDAESGDARSWYNLAIAEYAQGKQDAALAAMDRTLQLNREQPPAWLYRGVLLQEAGRHEEAAISFLRGVKYAERLGMQPSDPEMQRLMAHAAGIMAAELDRRIDAALAPIVAEFGAEAIRRIRRGSDIFVGKTPIEYAHPQWRPGLFSVPGLEPKTFFDRDDFPWAADVEAATDDIRREMLAVLETGDGLAAYVNHAEGTPGARTWAGINRNPAWSTFHFYRHGQRYDDNCRRCPRTAEVLDSIDLQRVPGYGPEAMFSVLRPHTRIPAHYGSVNGRVIVHLPLVVPPDCGALKVGDEARGWTEGELMFFDDSFRHEAWNDSDETRVVLIFDTWNPQLSAAERAAFSATLQTAQAYENLVDQDV